MLIALSTLPVLGLVFFLLHRFTALDRIQIGGLLALSVVGGVLLSAAFAWPGVDVVTLQLAVGLAVALSLPLLGRPRGQERQERGDGPRRGLGRLLGPGGLVAFFAVILAANGALAYVAVYGLPAGWLERIVPPGAGAVQSVFPGVVHHDYQEKEAQFNRRAEALREQQARAWEVRKGWLGEPRAGMPTVFQVRVTRPDRTPVTNASVTGTFLRPSDSRKDLPFTMTEGRPGEYRVEVVLPEPGQWELELSVRYADAHHEVYARTRVADDSTS
jgi:nitrogen fixation protein FixH